MPIFYALLAFCGIEIKEGEAHTTVMGIIGAFGKINFTSSNF
jgi:hypothetical protein